MKRLCALVLLAGLAAAPLAGEDSWISIGPWGGSVSSLVVNPRNPRTLYAGTNNGLFKSTDGGGSWTYLSQALPYRTVQSLAISPSASDHVYVAVGTFEEGWVFNSRDGGVSWQEYGFGIPVDSLAVHPREPGIAVASTYQGIYKTTDGGVAWAKVFSSTEQVAIKSLIYDPAQPATLYAGSSGGVLKSTDGGSSWTTASTGLAQAPVEAIVLEPKKPSVLYAATRAGVFKSPDAGRHWRLANQGLAGEGVLSLAASPAVGNLPATVWAGTATGLFRSRNGGASWVRASRGLRNQRIAALAIHPAAPRTLWAASGQARVYRPGPGLFKSVNGGDQWRISNRGIAAEYVTTFAVDPQSPGVLWAALGQNGVWRTADGGRTWLGRNHGLTSSVVNDLTLDPGDSNTVWAGTDGGLFRTVDGGLNWLLRSEGVVDPSNGALLEVSRVRLDPTDPRVIWIGTSRGLYRSLDEGATWTWIPVNPLSDATRIIDLLIDPRNPQALLTTYAGIGGLVLARSTDGGLAWTMSETDGYGLAREPADPEHVVLGRFERFADSRDGGQTWSNRSHVPGIEAVRSVAIDPVDGSIWAGAYGLFHVSADGSIWTPFPELEYFTVRDLEFDSSGVLYVGARGIHKRVQGAADSGD